MHEVLCGDFLAMKLYREMVHIYIHTPEVVIFIWNILSAPRILSVLDCLADNNDHHIWFQMYWKRFLRAKIRWTIEFKRFFFLPVSFWIILRNLNEAYEVKGGISLHYTVPLFRWKNWLEMVISCISFGDDSENANYDEGWEICDFFLHIFCKEWSIAGCCHMS